MNIYSNPFENNTVGVKNANVVISIEGLAIFNFNEANENWEALLQRNLATHDLKISIFKTVNEVSTALAEYVNIPKNEMFFIRSNGANVPAERAIHDGSAKDLNNTLDLSSEELHADLANIFNKDHGVETSFLSISDCTLYSRNVPDENYDIEIAGRSTITRKTTNVIGADLICDVESTLEIITSTDVNLIDPIVIEDGTIYFIRFDNSCTTPEPDNTDFQYYYDFLSVPTANKAKISVAGGDPPTKTGSCQCAISTNLGIDINGNPIRSLSELL